MTRNRFLILKFVAESSGQSASQAPMPQNQYESIRFLTSAGALDSLMEFDGMFSLALGKAPERCRFFA
jgi:hypothetical protein